jgi:hypothetical protein
MMPGTTVGMGEHKALWHDDYFLAFGKAKNLEIVGLARGWDKLLGSVVSNRSLEEAGRG